MTQNRRRSGAARRANPVTLNPASGFGSCSYALNSLSWSRQFIHDRNKDWPNERLFKRKLVPSGKWLELGVAHSPGT